MPRDKPSLGYAKIKKEMRRLVHLFLCIWFYYKNKRAASDEAVRSGAWFSPSVVDGKGVDGSLVALQPRNHIFRENP